MPNRLASVGEVPPANKGQYRNTQRTRQEGGTVLTTLVGEIKQCGRRKDLQGGKHLHSKTIKAGYHNNRYVAHTLISMYSKCSCMQHAQDVFESMSQHDVVSWTVLILGYVQNDENVAALDVYMCMDCAPNCFTFAAALKACVGLNKKTCLEQGRVIHQQAKERGCDKDVYVASSLVDIYSKCGCMCEAQGVFDNMTKRDVVVWTALIMGYVKNEESLIALKLFDNMDCAPNSFTFTAALKACACMASDNKKTWLQKGGFIHKQARECGLDKEIFVASVLVDMYGKCGNMEAAWDVFENMIQRDVVSWTALILGYVENDESLIALDLFASMDCAPDRCTFVAAIKACASIGALETGQKIHNRIRELGLEKDEMVVTSLVDFYGKCGKMAVAEEVFKKMNTRNIVSWTALIGGYNLVGDTDEVFRVVKKMQEAGVQMNGVTVLLILTACSHAGMVEEAQRYFESMSKYGIHASVEHYTCMVDMLGRNNRLQEALSLVCNMPFEADSFVWTTLLGACKKWSNVEVGEIAFYELVNNNYDEVEVSVACVLTGHIYRRLGMHREEEEVEARRKAVTACKTPERTWWRDGEGRVHSFVVGDKTEEVVKENLMPVISVMTQKA